MFILVWIWIVCFILAWIVCGILAYGLIFGYWQKGFPDLTEKDYTKDIIWSLLYGLIGGPFGLLPVMIFAKGGFKHGLKFW